MLKFSLKKTFIFLALIVSTVAFSACLKKPIQDQVQQPANEQNGNSLGDNFKGSLKNLLGMGAQSKCTWQAEEDGSRVEGVVYVDGERSKMEMTIIGMENDSSFKLTSYTITDGDWVYSWSDNSKQGSKFKISEMEKTVAGFEEEYGNMAFDDSDNEDDDYIDNFEQEYNYACQPWKIDQTVFQLPANITFLDMNETMKQAQEQNKEMLKSLGDVCSNLPEAQRAECIKAMEEAGGN